MYMYSTFSHICTCMYMSCASKFLRGIYMYTGVHIILCIIYVIGLGLTVLLELTNNLHPVLGTFFNTCTLFFFSITNFHTFLQYYRMARRKALETTHPTFFQSRRRSSSGSTPTSPVSTSKSGTSLRSYDTVQ